MPSWLWRKVVEATGPAPGTPAAEIQEHYLAVVRAGQRGDAAGQDGRDGINFGSSRTYETVAF
jgi:hypothetical protein